MNKRKIVGILVILAAIGIVFGSHAKAEKEEKEALDKLRKEISTSEASENDTVETEVEKHFETTDKETETETETETEPEPERQPLFPWIESLESEQDLGIISIIHENDTFISCALGFGGTTKASLSGYARLHEDLSNQYHLFILAHNNEQYGSTSLFSNLKKVAVGDLVQIEMLDGTVLRFTVDEILPWISEDDYEANNFEVCTKSELTLATCSWASPNGEKGRQIVYCSLVTEEQ